MGRPEQTRLLSLVMLIGLAMLALTQAANPDTWMWIWKFGQPVAAKPLDTRLPTDGRLALAGGKAPATGVEHPPSPVLPGIDKDSLADVRDDSKVRSEERHVEYDILRVLGETPSAEIAKASIGPVAFVEIFEQPQSYRGMVVTLDAHLRRCDKVNAGVNDEGLETFYQLWLTPDDRPNEVVCVCCAELPKGITEGAGLDEPVRFDAVMFKRMAYQAQDKEWRIAPLLLARTVQRRAQKVAAPAQPMPGNTQTIVTATIAALCVAVALGAVAWVTTRRASRTNPYARSTPKQGNLEFENLRELEVSPEVLQALKRDADTSEKHPAHEPPETHA
jgi:hypothetical protein